MFVKDSLIPDDDCSVVDTLLSVSMLLDAPVLSFISDVVIDETSQADDGQEDGPGLNTEEMSEWEKKIESASKENPVEEKPKEKEVKKKKGFFGRKKK